VFIEGLIFVLLAATGLRVKFAKAIPNCIKLATTAGMPPLLLLIGCNEYH
jgi:AGZA family xanthine/uracil permease-like MFS transporter